MVDDMAVDYVRQNGAGPRHPAGALARGAQQQQSHLGHGPAALRGSDRQTFPTTASASGRSYFIGDGQQTS